MPSIYLLTSCPWQRDVQYGVEYGPRWRRLEGGDDALFDRTDILYWNGSSRYLGEKKKNLVMGLICIYQELGDVFRAEVLLDALGSGWGEDLQLQLR